MIVMLKWGEQDYGSLQHSPPNTTRLMTFCRSNIFYLFFEMHSVCICCNLDSNDAKHSTGTHVL